MRKRLALVLMAVVMLSMMPLAVFAEDDHGADAHSNSMSYESGENPISDESTTEDPSKVQEDDEIVEDEEDTTVADVNSWKALNTAIKKGAKVINIKTSSIKMKNGAKTIKITHDLEINGSCKLTNAGKKCMFEIAASNTKLSFGKGISFTTKNAAASGAIIKISKSNCTVDGGNYEHCKSSDNGGAILISGKNATIKHCRFSNCYAKGNGGAIYVSKSGKAAVIRNCNFNKCDCGGAGMNVCGYKKTTKIIDCTSSGNSAGESDLYANCSYRDSSSGSVMSCGNPVIVFGIAGLAIIAIAVLYVTSKKRKVTGKH